MNGEWFAESLYPDIGQRFRMGRVLHRVQTGLQDLVIFENPVMGRIMALDGVIQTTETDEAVYHEMLTHVPILAHGAVERVLIIGGGDGGILRRCLNHDSVRQATMVEIDRSVVDMSIEHLPTISAGAFDDPRTDLVIADGAAFVKTCAGQYQVVIIDSTDPTGPGEVLFTAEFYADCKRCLAPGGILVTQNGVPMFQPQELRNTRDRLRPLFTDVGFFLAAVPTYYGGFMALGWACDNAALRRQTAEQIRPRFEAAGLDPYYYTPEVHVAAFALPRFMGKVLE
ncbi:spermidine synthase [uncultured Gammaproteobacteria bacterium]